MRAREHDHDRKLGQEFGHDHVDIDGVARRVVRGQDQVGRLEPEQRQDEGFAQAPA